MKGKRKWFKKKTPPFFVRPDFINHQFTNRLDLAIVKVEFLFEELPSALGHAIRAGGYSEFENHPK